jgi:hypothetical protein
VRPREPSTRRARDPELWPLGTEALALAVKVSVLEAKRLGHRAVLRLSLTSLHSALWAAGTF